MSAGVRRREFIRLIGGAAAAWPVTASAQQAAQRRIGVLLPAVADDSEFQAGIGAFQQGLQQAGWSIGPNLRIDIHWATPDAAEIRRHAAELAAQLPDVILAHGASTVGPLLKATPGVPIVFAVLGDPVGAGYVNSLARPGGNVTGFMLWEYSLGGKWLELLKQILPQVKRAAILRDPDTPTGMGQFGVIQAAATSLGVEVRPLDVRAVGEIDRAVMMFAQSSNDGLIVTSSGFSSRYRSLIAAAAACYKLPAVYYESAFARVGGLISYGPDFVDQYRRSADYVSRILNGEKPANLPVQTPTKYELVINLKTAKALGLTVPLPLLGLADEVIE